MEYTGEESCIHFSSKYTCAGDEIGWDFCRRVERGKLSFSAFCADMTDMYCSVYPISAPFMCKSTFVTWYFSWASKMKIDFRKDVDPVCQHSPKMLACDGTHVGISLRNMKKFKPVSKPDMLEPDSENVQVHVPKHKRFNRVFLHDDISGVSVFNIREARHHLNFLCLQTLCRDIPPEEQINETVQQERNTTLLTVVRSLGESCFSFIEKFVNKSFSGKMRQTSAKLLKLLASDSPVSSVVPLRFMTCLKLICSSNINSTSVNKIYSFSPELANLLQAAMDMEEDKTIVVKFAKYLAEFVTDLHQHDRTTPAPSVIPNSYNPSTGTAYYFTPHGNQIRRLPDFNISGASALYDDKPINTCNKKFPGVSFGGFGYIFLWFCVLHGHCYGFHLISGGEGRKDPFASLYKYIEEAPEELYYDYACGLQEYSLNRCPNFFQNTRFWHDFFHGIQHKCSPALKSARISPINVVNSEICEQFNSYIQSIKYTATHLSHDHFCFFIQFFIHLWNAKKTEKYRKVYDVVVSGCM